MSIKKTEESNQKVSIEILQSRLDNLLSDSYLENVPQDILQRLTDFKDELSHDISMYSNSEANVISGKMLDSNDILAIIIDATGYNKWGLDETCKLDKKEIKYVTEKFGVSVKEKEIMQYRFYRSTNSRDDINMISVTALPGYNAILMDTDRADIPVDSLLTPTEMQETIQYHFENN